MFEGQCIGNLISLRVTSVVTSIATIYCFGIKKRLRLYFNSILYSQMLIVEFIKKLIRSIFLSYINNVINESFIKLWLQWRYHLLFLFFSFFFLNIYLIFQYSKIQCRLQKTQQYNTKSSIQEKIISNMQDMLNVKKQQHKKLYIIKQMQN